MTPLLLENVTKQFRQGDRPVQALAGVNLTVESGQFLAIMGASGSGKSTLLHLAAGLAKPDSGKILVNGTDLTTLRDGPLTLFRRRQIGLVFQAFNLIPTLTARDNIALPLLLDGVPAKSITAKVDAIMAVLGIAGRAHHRPDALSGGEQQRVAIGRALITDAAIILADEPTGNLDSANSRAVCELLRDLCAIHNKTIVMVTHEPSVAAYAQEVVIIRDGAVLSRFPTSQTGSSQGLAAKYQESLR